MLALLHVVEGARLRDLLGLGLGDGNADEIGDAFHGLGLGLRYGLVPEAEEARVAAPVRIVFVVLDDALPVLGGEVRGDVLRRESDRGCL